MKRRIFSFFGFVWALLPIIC
uniref:Uncharacterized protein n=1 Tax=Arundo donax TaxID=35708 RepID=A0A0A9BY98_ARUDO